MKKNNEIDMINGPLFFKILSVALPLASISILQQMFNAADVAVVGNFASENAIAAVGANTPVINIFLTFFTGLATGGNIAISNFIGRQNGPATKKAVHTVFSISLVSAVLVFIIGQIIANPVIHAINTPDEILKSAMLYFRIYLGAMFFAVIFNFNSAILRSKGDTKRPLICLIISGIANVLLNLVFVIVFHLDVAGVAIATLISNAFCAFATTLILTKDRGDVSLDLKELGVDKETLKFALRIGLPTAFQGALFSFSNIIIQSAINSLGANCIAGNTAALNYEYIAYFIVSAFSQTATTFYSQNYAAQKYDRTKKIFYICLASAFGFCFILSGTFLLFNNFFISLFSTNAAVMAYALLRLKYVAFLEPLTAINEIPSGALRAMGVALPPTIISIMGTCVLRIFWVNTVFKLHPDALSLLIVYPISWILIGGCMMVLYFHIYKKKTRASA